MNQKVAGSDSTGHSPDFRTQPRYEALGGKKSAWWMENEHGMKKNGNKKWDYENETKLRIPSHCITVQLVLTQSMTYR